MWLARSRFPRSCSAAVPATRATREPPPRPSPSCCRTPGSSNHRGATGSGTSEWPNANRPVDSSSAGHCSHRSCWPGPTKWKAEHAMSLSEMFHVGIVVPDLDAARARFTELLGTQWGPIAENEIEIRDADGNDLVVPNRICYSTQPPYLELIQEVPGTPWVCNEHSNLHHIGFYSDSLVADSGALRAAECPLELLDGHGDGPPVTFTYHRDPLGVRVEFVNAEIRAMMEQAMFRAPGA